MTRARDEGSVYRRKDGRWVAALRWPDGKRKYRYRRTQREAMGQLVELHALRAEGQPPPSDRLTIGAVIELWRRRYVSTLAPLTQEKYDHQVEHYIRPQLDKVRLAALPVARLTAWRDQLLVDGVPAPTVGQCVHLLRAILSWAMTEDLVARNVAVKVAPPKYRRATRRPLTAGETTDLLAAIQAHRMHALIVLALTCGLRRGELLGVTWGAIDEKDGHLRVLQQVQRIRGRGLLLTPAKTERSEAPVALTRLFLGVLKDHRTRLIRERMKAGPMWQGRDSPVAADALVFPSPLGKAMEPARVWREWRDMLQQAGIEHRPLHGTRHTTATLLRALGVPMHVIQDVLRHSKQATTRGYAHGDISEQRAAADKLDELLGGVLG